jgi:phage I-like protein
MNTAQQRREEALFATELRGLTFGEQNGRVKTTIEVCRDSTRQHAKYGTIVIDQAMRDSLVRNFNAKVREIDELPIDYDHQNGPAGGWIYALRNEGSSLKADVWLPASAAERIRAGEYRFFSPEWDPNYQDPKTGKKHGPTLMGGGWTNRPTFRELPTVTCSEDGKGDDDCSPERIREFLQMTDTGRNVLASEGHTEQVSSEVEALLQMTDTGRNVLASEGHTEQVSRRAER